MSNIEDRISALLSSPEGMEKVMQIARSLGAGGGTGEGTGGGEAAGSGAPSSSAQSEETAPSFASQENTEANKSPDLSAVLSALSGSANSSQKNGPDAPNIDPRFMATAMKIMNAYMEPNDDRAKLIGALRPYIGNNKQRSIDNAIEALRLARVVKRALGSLGGSDRLV